MYYNVHVAMFLAPTLMKKFQQKPGTKYDQNKWQYPVINMICIHKVQVNRGELFHITFRFFVGIEKEVQLLLPEHMANSDHDVDSGESIVRQSMHSEDVN